MAEHADRLTQIYHEIVRLNQIRDVDVVSLRQAQGRIQGFDQRIETLVEEARELERRDERIPLLAGSVQAVA